MKNKITGLCIALLVICVLGVTGMNVNDGSVETVDGFTYESNVCIYKNGELVECGGNTLHTTGQNLLKTAIGNDGNDLPVKLISLCNVTDGCGTPSAGATEDYTACVNGGLENATGTYASVADGNWTVSHEFTSTSNVTTNVTRILNDKEVAFASKSFTSVHLMPNDKITCTWNIKVS